MRRPRPHPARRRRTGHPGGRRRAPPAVSASTARRRGGSRRTGGCDRLLRPSRVLGRGSRAHAPRLSVTPAASRMPPPAASKPRGSPVLGRAEAPLADAEPGPRRDPVASGLRELAGLATRRRRSGGRGRVRPRAAAAPSLGSRLRLLGSLVPPLRLLRGRFLERIDVLLVPGALSEGRGGGQRPADRKGSCAAPHPGIPTRSGSPEGHSEWRPLRSPFARVGHPRMPARGSAPRAPLGRGRLT